jgi:CheY-like chemotaxis protein
LIGDRQTYDHLALTCRGNFGSAKHDYSHQNLNMAKILLVEDNEMNRDMLSRRLIRKGYDVVMAVDGQDGVEQASSTTPDLILMDMSLPVIDGWEATRQLKSADSTKGIPIIALTAHAMSGDREKALAAGCDDYDTKPIDLPQLLAKIEALLTKNRG